MIIGLTKKGRARRAVVRAGEGARRAQVENNYDRQQPAARELRHAMKHAQALGVPGDTINSDWETGRQRVRS